MTGRVLGSHRHELVITYRNRFGRYLFLAALAAGVVFLWGLGQ